MIVTDPQKAAFTDIKTERMLQDEKWGDVGFTTHLAALAVLGEEFGEVAKAIIEGARASELRNEIIQCAAVCVKWLEFFETMNRGATRINQDGGNW